MGSFRKFILSVFLWLSVSGSAQSFTKYDSLQIGSADQIFADDYGSLYIYKNRNFSLTKSDTLNKLQGRLMLAVPFKVQDVQNPLNIALFSENAQQFRFVDRNLNQIQQLNLRDFGFIKMAYAEDLQQLWLLDESSKRLLQYNFRENNILNAFPLDLDYSAVQDMVVYRDKVYLILNDEFAVYNLNGQRNFTTKINGLARLRRENGQIYVLTNNKIFIYQQDKNLSQTFSAAAADFVDKNSSAYFELRNNKLYIYPIAAQEKAK